MADVHAHRLTGIRAATTLVELGFPAISAGVIARRRPVLALLERIQADERAARRWERLRTEFGRGPVELVVPGRRVIVILDPGDIGRVLAGAPAPFDPANREKRAALEQFQPHGVLISQGPIRERRRSVNETALDTGAPLHRLAEPFAAKVAGEAEVLIEQAGRRGAVDAADFTAAWWRLVRRVVLGEQARTDDAITDELWRLRGAANWSFAAPPLRKRRERFLARLYGYVETAEPGSLAGALADIPAGGAIDPVGQMPQWLFAFDAAGIALSRALALLTEHPEQRARARADAEAPERARLRPYLRACVLESIRLWPTTPVILRDTTEWTRWRTGSEQFALEPGAALLILAPAFHRDRRLPFADSFDPEIWLDGRAEQYPQLVPFSAGPAECPGRNLVLFVTSALLAHLLSGPELRLRSHDLTPGIPLPATLDNYRLEFTVEPAGLRSVAPPH
ncbi:cytochrome P450 [Nocardia flavorosea]|uniref:cytochrome P450 n=1 Tax=Nocardia flavorosea TaxID=53429 RepID=UPI001895C1F1|nr:cytochrome P450 [Nocardia flavorosea]MBF6348166.1 cytochrome P450 [Nocardia flavorosea]